MKRPNAKVSTGMNSLLKANPFLRKPKGFKEMQQLHGGTVPSSLRLSEAWEECPPVRKMKSKLSEDDEATEPERDDEPYTVLNVEKEARKGVGFRSSHRWSGAINLIGDDAGSSKLGYSGDSKHFVKSVKTLLSRRLWEEAALDKDDPKENKNSMNSLKADRLGSIATPKGLQEIVSMLVNQKKETTEEKLRRLERPRRLRKIIMEGIDIWIRRAIRDQNLSSIIEFADLIVPLHDEILLLTKDQEEAFNAFRDIEAVLNSLAISSTKAKEATEQINDFLYNGAENEDVVVLISAWSEAVSELKARLKKLKVPEMLLTMWCPYRALDKECDISASMPWGGERGSVREEPSSFITPPQRSLSAGRVKQVLAFMDPDAWKYLYAPMADKIRYEEARKSMLARLSVMSSARDSLLHGSSFDSSRSSANFGRRTLMEELAESDTSSNAETAESPAHVGQVGKRGHSTLKDKDTRPIWEKLQDAWTKVVDSTLVLKNVEGQERGRLLSPKRLAEEFVAQELQEGGRTLSPIKALKRPPMWRLPFVKFEPSFPAKPVKPAVAAAPVVPAPVLGEDPWVDLEDGVEPAPSRLQLFPMRSVAPKHKQGNNLQQRGLGPPIVDVGEGELPLEFREEVNSMPTTIDSPDSPWWKDVRISPLTGSGISGLREDGMRPRQWHV